MANRSVSGRIRAALLEVAAHLLAVVQFIWLLFAIDLDLLGVLGVSFVDELKRSGVFIVRHGEVSCYT